MVVLFLGLTVMATVVVVIVPLLNSRTIPESLIALGSAAIGALAGLLAPSPTGK